MEPISNETTIAEIVNDYPEAIEILHRAGLYCFS